MEYLNKYELQTCAQKNKILKTCQKNPHLAHVSFTVQCHFIATFDYGWHDDDMES